MKVFKRDYKEYKLNNGLVVALQKTPTHIVKGELEVKVGAIHARKGEEGLAHFIEHCLATGSSSKYTSKKSDEFRGNLGYFNAFTDIGETSFVSEMLPEDIKEWLKFMSDHIFNPSFDPENVNGERKRILREIADRKSGESAASILFQEAFYRNHPMNLMIKGKEEVISKTSINKLKRFHSRLYHPNNMDLILAGALPKNIEALIEKYFGKQKPGENTRTKFPRLKPLKKKTIFHTSATDLIDKEDPKRSSAEIEFVCVTVPENHPDSTALSIISHVLGESCSTSRLFKVLGLKKGLAYFTTSSYGSTYNAGSFEVSAKVHAGRLEEAIDCIFEEFKKLREKGITKKELKMCQRQAKYELAETLDTSEGYIIAIERKLRFGWSPESFISDCENITLEEIRRVANKYLPESRKKGKYVMSIRDPLKYTKKKNAETRI